MNAAAPSSGQPVAAASDEALAQLRVTQRQISRLPPLYAVADLLVVWMLLRHDFVAGAAAWVALTLVLQVLRWRLVAHAREGDARAPERRLDAHAWLAPLMGLARALPVAMLFTLDARHALLEQLVLTIVYLGNAAGGVGVAGGRWWNFASWALPALGSLALGWALNGSVEGAIVALCIVMLAALLTAQVHEQGRAVAAMAQLARDNRALAASLRAQRDQVEQASRAQSRFFAATGHDLRQPLHALQANAAALQLLASQRGDAQVGQVAGAVRRGAEHAQSLLDDVLDLTRLHVGALAPQDSDVDLALLAQQACDEFQAVAQARGLTLRLVLDAGFAQGGLTTTVRTDRAMLGRMLRNLLANALKYTHAGEVVVGLHRRDRGRVALSVTDTGPGIDADERERIFEEFVRGRAGFGGAELGLGLGLSIVQRMAVLLGIELVLDSEPGRGTRVELLIGAGTDRAVS